MDVPFDLFPSYHFPFDPFLLPKIAMVPLEKDIPPVYQICETLGFDIDDNKELIDATQNWHRRWISESAPPGYTLTQWKSPHLEAHLQSMIVDFLEIAGYGEKFWGSGRWSLALGAPKYPVNQWR